MTQYVIFAADNGDTGTELWAAPFGGTGATLLADIRPGWSSGLPSLPGASLGGIGVFMANDGVNGA